MSATGASFTGTGSCSGGAWSVSGTFTTAGSILVTATSSGVASATTTVSVSGGTLHHLGFVGTPPASITSGAPTTFQIQRYDSAGNPLGCVGSGSLTLTPAVFGTGATCSGTGTSSVFSATGTFGAAGAVTITATQGAHSVTHSATVVAGAAHHLGFVSPPASTTAGSTVSLTSQERSPVLRVNTTTGVAD
ncbi:hypothetical protein EB061_06410 [bacterium]|nr:hypothetical protein [bacterium]